MEMDVRMSKLLVGGMVGAMSVAGVVLAAEAPSADVKGAAEQPSAPPAVQAAPAPAVAKSPEERLRDEMRTRLNGTAWSLDLRPMGGESGEKPQKDSMTFDERQVTSERLGKAGYGSSNYSLNITDEQKVIWETMQSKEGEGLVFWRGELRGEGMRGVLSEQPTGGTPKNFSFIATQTGGPKAELPVEMMPSAPPQVAPAQPPAVSEPPASPPPAPKTEKKKKHRGIL